jgi:membrane fusion protein (multidrug efflux system)
VFGQRDDAKVIPEEALVPQSGRQFVYRLVEGPDQDTRIAQRVEVKLGLRKPGRVEIVDGLNAGDIVVTAGQQRIQRDGTPVRMLEIGKGNGAANAGATGARGGAATSPTAAASAGVPTTATAATSSGSAAAQAPAAPARVAGPNPCEAGASPRSGRAT